MIIFSLNQNLDMNNTAYTKTPKTMKNMLRSTALFVLCTFATVFKSTAEEGMLIPSLIAAFEDDMQAFGMKLSAEDIYSVNNSSLKDAILHFGGGCTAELVSGEGLLLTNHHCGYSQIQSHSSVKNDYLKNGFWAKTKADELKNPGLTAARVVRITDVTETVFFGTEGLTGSALETKIRENIETVRKDATTGNHYSAKVSAFNYGNEYFMVVKETFKDVRLVGTPPNSIGKFGGDTDNWVWPRHTGDFSVFRVYADGSNMPSDVSDNNVPYKPLHFLPVSMKDKKTGDFTMVYGFPGSTEQHLSSENLRFIMDQERPARIKMRDLSLSVINASMGSSDELRIMYSSKQARIANAWKKWIGQLGGLKTVDAIQIKLDREKRYNDMANSKPEWKEKYGSIISDMNALVGTYKNSEFGYSMAIEYLYVGPEIFKRARTMDKFIQTCMMSMNEEDFNAEVAIQRTAAESFFKNYDEETDRKIFMLLTEEYRKQMGANLPAEIKDKTSEVLTESIYSNSVLTNKVRFMEFLDGLKYKSFVKYRKKLDKNDAKSADKRKIIGPYSIKDEGHDLWNATIGYFRETTLPEVQMFHFKMEALLKTYVAGKKEMFPNDKHWPDANSTMRISFGKLEGSAPHDGMTYTEHTTVDGIIAKNNTGNPDFEILPRMKELAAERNYGDYDQDGELWVCFSSSNHTTGGNSGSPVIDAEGNLMGLNFDRSWESTMSDFMFDASRCRNITVDIRYVLWVMDVYAGAGHLVDEMTKAE
jgi:hypothetical protein